MFDHVMSDVCHVKNLDYFRKVDRLVVLDNLFGVMFNLYVTLSVYQIRGSRNFLFGFSYEFQRI